VSRAGIELKVTGAREAADALATASREFPARRAKAVDKVERIALDGMRAQFESAGAAFGTKWRPLSPGYRAAKVAAGHSPMILVRTGELRRSLTRRGAVRRTSGGLELVSSRSTKDGESMITAHARRRRHIAHPQTGLGGPYLRRVIGVVVGMADELAAEING
jgi:hypothetical protein